MAQPAETSHKSQADWTPRLQPTADTDRCQLGTPLPGRQAQPLPPACFIEPYSAKPNSAFPLASRISMPKQVGPKVTGPIAQALGGKHWGKGEGGVGIVQEEEGHHLPMKWATICVHGTRPIGQWKLATKSLYTSHLLCSRGRAKRKPGVTRKGREVNSLTLGNPQQRSPFHMITLHGVQRNLLSLPPHIPFTTWRGPPHCLVPTSSSGTTSSLSHMILIIHSSYVCEADANTQLVNTEPSLLQGFSEEFSLRFWTQHFHQPIDTWPCILCFCLKASSLI